MINANDNSRMVARILGTIAREYHWPEFPVSTSRARQTAEVAEARLVACTGRYEFANNQMIALRDGARPTADRRGRLRGRGIPAGSRRSFRRDASRPPLHFLKDDDGQVSGLLLEENGKARKVPRIGPLFHSLKPQTDPDPARTEKVVAVLKALGEGGRRPPNRPSSPPGRAPTSGTAGPYRSSRPFGRSSSSRNRTCPAARSSVTWARSAGSFTIALVTDKPDRGLLVHLTPDGKITDFDIVED